MIDPVPKDEFISNMEKAEQDRKYSENAVKRFWDWMYESQDGIVQVCAFPVPTQNKDKADMGEGKWVHAESFSEFEEFCSLHSGLWRYHVYSGVNALDVKPEYGRGSVKHIDKVKRLSFDIETKQGSYQGATKQEVWWTYRYALAEVKFMIESYGVLPMVVMSENGIHLHFRVNFPCNEEYLRGRQHLLSKYITHRAMNNQYVEAILEKCPSGITIDQDDVSDPPRVMKVPGSRGIKSETGRLCGIIHEPLPSDAGVINESDVDLDQSVFEQDLDQQHKSQTSLESVDTTPSELESDSSERLKELMMNEPKVRRFWEGDIVGYDSRSEAEFAFVLKLLKHEFTQQDIVNIMWASGMSKWEEESDHYRERTIANAIDYFDGNVVKNAETGSLSFSYE